MFYCTVYRRQSKGYVKGRIDLCLAFETINEAKQAEQYALKVAKGLGASITDKHRFSNGSSDIEGIVNCEGPNIFKQGTREKYFSIYIETDETLAHRRWPYHPISPVKFDGKVFMQKALEPEKDWYEELSEINS